MIYDRPYTPEDDEDGTTVVTDWVRADAIDRRTTYFAGRSSRSPRLQVLVLDFCAQFFGLGIAGDCEAVFQPL